MAELKSRKIFRKQPILCPWITSQPYHSPIAFKNRLPISQPSLTHQFPHRNWNHGEVPASYSDLPSASSHFFYFHRLMQLFPETHPATLHTMMAICKNDFHCALDQLLYARRCRQSALSKRMLQESTSTKSGNEELSNTSPPTEGTMIDSPLQSNEEQIVNSQAMKSHGGETEGSSHVEEFQEGDNSE